MDYSLRIAMKAMRMAVLFMVAHNQPEVQAR